MVDYKKTNPSTKSDSVVQDDQQQLIPLLAVDSAPEYSRIIQKKLGAESARETFFLPPLTWVCLGKRDYNFCGNYLLLFKVCDWWFSLWSYQEWNRGLYCMQSMSLKQWSWLIISYKTMLTELFFFPRRGDSFGATLVWLENVTMAFSQANRSRLDMTLFGISTTGLSVRMWGRQLSS